LQTRWIYITTLVFRSVPLKLVHRVGFALTFCSADYVHFSEIGVEYCLMKVARLRCILIKLRKVLGCSIGDTFKDIFVEVKHHDIVLCFVFVSAEDKDALVVLRETCGVAEPALEDLLFVFELEEHAPLAAGGVEASHHSHARVGLDASEDNQLVVKLDGAMLVSRFWQVVCAC
jgi:hypothetical protein